jgi:SAM-dependent methyltransferase
MDSKAHWNAIYEKHEPSEVSWYQAEAHLSFSLIRDVAPSLDSAVLDVGGGASTLVDALLDAGYRDVTVLDVAEAALTAARSRLGDRSANVQWRVADVLAAPFDPQTIDVWHDRAVFHFLTGLDERRRYVEQVRRAVRRGGHVLVATFAEDGPTRCSGLRVMRYDAEELHGEFGDDFRLVRSVREEHHTPWGAEQAFTYCLCRIERIE